MSFKLKMRIWAFLGGCCSFVWGLSAFCEAQEITGLWGSALYRVELNVAGNKITGSYSFREHPQEPAGKIQGQLQGDGRSFVAEWTHAAGPDQGRFQTYLELDGRGQFLRGWRWTEETEPMLFVLRRAVEGTLLDVLTEAEGEETKDTAQKDGGQDAPSFSGFEIKLADAAASVLLAGAYDVKNFGLRLAINWDKPGMILDTVGVNAAAPGSFSVGVDEQGIVRLQIFAPQHNSPHKKAPGWHIMYSGITAKRGEWTTIAIQHTPAQWKFSVGSSEQNEEMILPLPVAASGQPLYVGDFPGDAHWPPPVQAKTGMTGIVRVLSAEGLQLEDDIAKNMTGGLKTETGGQTPEHNKSTADGGPPSVAIVACTKIDESGRPMDPATVFVGPPGPPGRAGKPGAPGPTPEIIRLVLTFANVPAGSVIEFVTNYNAGQEILRREITLQGASHRLRWGPNPKGALPPGNYVVSVHYRGQEIGRHSFEVRQGPPGPTASTNPIR